ncbi:MAG: hypothetical protein IJ348_02940 [Alistipes sp.]|nr:hypothetical protein [Alistipes sp.]
MRDKLSLKPTPQQTFRLIGHGVDGDLAGRLARSREAEARGLFEQACNERYLAFQDIVEILPEDEAVELDRNHPNTLAAMEIILGSAVDNYLVGDAELAATQLELLLDCDSEDPLEATPTLALCYIALGEWDSLAEIECDVEEKMPLRPLLRMCRTFATEGSLAAEDIASLRRHAEVVAEFKASEHPTDHAYVEDISSERPSRKALARELYLRCEPAFAGIKGFIEQLSQAL